jgi:hypothetical protein
LSAYWLIGAIPPLRVKATPWRVKASTISRMVSGSGLALLLHRLSTTILIVSSDKPDSRARSILR